jgi:DNA-binding PadR family transcriptional regulator
MEISGTFLVGVGPGALDMYIHWMANGYTERSVMVKKHTSYRISEEGKQLIKLLARRLGVTETAVVEMAIREMAEKRGVKV